MSEDFIDYRRHRARKIDETFRRHWGGNTGKHDDNSQTVTTTTTHNEVGVGGDNSMGIGAGADVSINVRNVSDDIAMQAIYEQGQTARDAMSANTSVLGGIFDLAKNAMQTVANSTQQAGQMLADNRGEAATTAVTNSTDKMMKYGLIGVIVLAALFMFSSRRNNK